MRDVFKQVKRRGVWLRGGTGINHFKPSEIIDNVVTTKYWTYKLELDKYGKVWALTKKELENK